MSKTLILFVLLRVLMAAQTPESAIRAVLDKQVADWNRGDVDAFLTTYDDNATFVGAEVSHGAAQVRERYRRRYPTPEKMGQVSFSDLQIQPLGDHHAYVIGKWHLTRSAAGGGDTGGIFTLVMENRGGVWRIILDHTS
jgi:uncharacterized protein (TIGR02246 family)